MPLNPKQQRFVAEYLKDSNATQAALRAGYSPKTAYSQGHDLLKKPEISEAVAKGTAEICARAEVSAEYVLSSLLSIAKRCQEQEEFDPAGANKSLELLGKHLKLWTDKTEHSGPGGKSITISIEGIVR